MIPDNVISLFLPPYAPELNPIERLWQAFKDHLAWKAHQNIEALQLKVDGLINAFTKDQIKSITSYPYLLLLFRPAPQPSDAFQPCPAEATEDNHNRSAGDDDFDAAGDRIAEPVEAPREAAEVTTYPLNCAVICCILSTASLNAVTSQDSRAVLMTMRGLAGSVLAGCSGACSSPAAICRACGTDGEASYSSPAILLS